MKITRCKIQAAEDFRSFNGYDMDEMKELFPDVYYDWLYDIRTDVKQCFISENPQCKFIGVQDTLGDYYIYKIDDPDFGPGWFEVSFEELSEYLR